MARKKKTARRRPGRPPQERAPWSPLTFAAICDAVGADPEMVGAALGVSASTVYRWRGPDGQHAPTPEQCSVVAEYLTEAAGSKVTCADLARSITRFRFQFGD